MGIITLPKSTRACFPPFLFHPFSHRTIMELFHDLQSIRRIRRPRPARPSPLHRSQSRLFRPGNRKTQPSSPLLSPLFLFHPFISSLQIPREHRHRTPPLSRSPRDTQRETRHRGRRWSQRPTTTTARGCERPQSQRERTRSTGGEHHDRSGYQVRTRETRNRLSRSTRGMDLPHGAVSLTLYSLLSSLLSSFSLHHPKIF